MFQVYVYEDEKATKLLGLYSFRYAYNICCMQQQSSLDTDLSNIDF